MLATVANTVGLIIKINGKLQISSSKGHGKWYKRVGHMAY